MAEELEDEPQEKPDFNAYLGMARRRCWHFAAPAFVCWLLVTAAGWIIPPNYRSGTLILVEQPTVPQQYVVPNISGDLQNRMDSITQQILSRTRLERIIEKLNLYPKERARLTPDDVVERMRKDIDIELVRSPEREQQLTAFNVYFCAHKPAVAQQVTNELTDLFISENLEVRQQLSENTTQFLQSQLDEARSSLTEQEKRLREYKDRYLGELPGQLQSNLEILAGLQSQLQAEQDSLGRAKQQHAYLESLIAQYQSVVPSIKPGDEAPVGLPAIDQELDRLRAQLTDLSSRYTEKHPDVRKLKEQIAKTEKMKQQIAADLNAKSKGGAKSDIPDTLAQSYSDVGRISPMIEVQSQLKANQLEIANRQESVKQLQAKIAEYQGRLNQTPVREQQLSDLSRDYDQSKANYESLLAKKNQSELATNLEKRQEGEHFRILDPPSLPTRPYSPNRFKLSCIGLFAGLVVGGAVAAGAEIADDRVYSDKELHKLIPAEVLVEIPPLPTIAEEKAQHVQAWRDAAAITLIVLCMLAGVGFTYLRS